MRIKAAVDDEMQSLGSGHWVIATELAPDLPGPEHALHAPVRVYAAGRSADTAASSDGPLRKANNSFPR